MDELIEKVQNTLEMRSICIPDDYDIKDVLFKKFNVIKIAGDFNDDLEENDERILIVLQKK